MKGALLAVIVAFVITAQADSRTLLNTQEVTWTPGIGKACQTVCPSPLVFSTPFGGNSPSYSCRINVDNGPPAAGYQTNPGQCTATVNSHAVTSSDYTCGCLDPTSVPGLDQPVGSSCGTSCTKSLLGTPGAALLDGNGSVCMPTSEMGKSNHFGSTDNGGCSFVAADGSASTTEAFSCVCSFAQSAATTG